VLYQVDGLSEKLDEADGMTSAQVGHTCLYLSSIDDATSSHHRSQVW